MINDLSDDPDATGPSFWLLLYTVFASQSNSSGYIGIEKPT